MFAQRDEHIRIGSIVTRPCRERRTGTHSCVIAEETKTKGGPLAVASYHVVLTPSAAHLFAKDADERGTRPPLRR
jgi:hypothetical protein